MPDISYPVAGGPGRGYLAVPPPEPAGPGTWRGVVVIHEAFGLNAETPHDVKVYPGSGHRFMSEASGVGAVAAGFARMSYQEADAHDAWQRIYAFFGEHLAG